MSWRPPDGNLLTRLSEEALDDDYAAVASRRASGAPHPRGRPATLAVFAASVAVLAILLTVAAVQTRSSASEAEADRLALIDRIEDEQDQVGLSQQAVSELEAEVDRLRLASLQVTQDLAVLEQQLENVQMSTGVVPVSGPGVRITVDNSPDGSDPGHISDEDLQELVNALWLAGAEAIAVGGQRLTSRSAIHTAGSAVTVNYRSLSPPYEVTAIGDPATLPAELLDTEGGQLFSTLQGNFGVPFTVETAESLTLPGYLVGVAQARPLPDSGVSP